MSLSGSGVTIGVGVAGGDVAPCLAAAIIFVTCCSSLEIGAGVGAASALSSPFGPAPQVTLPWPSLLAAAEFTVRNRIMRCFAPGFSKGVSLFIMIATPAIAAA